MRVIGFSFSKIVADRMKEAIADLKITTNIDVPSIKEAKNNILKTKEDLLEAEFKYTVLYEPGIAKVDLEGKMLISMEPKKAKEVLANWKKKKMSEDFKMILFNVVLKKASIKALNMEEELNLPLHVPMPAVRRTENQKN